MRTTTRQPLPLGFRIRIRDDVSWHDHPDGASTVLIGGSPLRAVHLSHMVLPMPDGQTLTVDGASTGRIARRLLDGNVADPVPGPAVEASELTVVVPVRDRPEQLDRCLAALSGLKVIVVDDASHDRATVERVVQRHPARLVALPDNLGPAGARNAGLAQVDTRFVAFVDSDVAVTPGALLGLTGHFTDPVVGLVGPSVRGVTRSSSPRWFERYDSAASSLTLGRRPCSVAPGAAVAWLPSACLIARTEALRGPRSVHGFSDGMRVGEDVDLVWRLLDQGWRVRYDPAYEALHDTRSTMAAWLGRKAIYGGGGAPLAARHGDAVAVARLSPLMAAAAAAILLRRRWSVPLAIFAAGAGARAVHRSMPGTIGFLPSTAIAIKGLGWSVRQESALLLRHWWPAALVACLGCRPARRMITTALLADTIVLFAIDRPRGPAGTSAVGPVAMIVGRRLDDLAYGAGLWLGAIRHRSLRALAIKITTTKPRRPATRAHLRLAPQEGTDR